jgi:hypothetical protein
MAKKKVTLTPIGTKAFAVAKSWVERGDEIKNAGAKVYPCKLITYVNEAGTVTGQWRSTIDKSTFTGTTHHICLKLEDAVKMISPKPKKNSKK